MSSTVFQPYLCLWLCLLCTLAEGIAQTITFRLQTPATTNEQAHTIFIAGSFNQWNPASSAYQLQRLAPNLYGISLKLSDAVGTTISYKFTQGSWEKVETDSLGRDIGNRTLLILAKKDTIIQTYIQNWKHMTSASQAPSTASANVHILDNQFDMPQLKRKRRIWLMLPLDYHLTQKRYPVIYMHDGQNLFDERTAFAGEWHVDKTLNHWQLHENGWGVIVVGIDNGGTERINEYASFMNSMGGGDGDEYAEFIVKNLKPYIDTHFRTLADRTHTATIGSSMGGLIAFYLGLKYPHIFQNIGVFSPSFWFSQRYFHMAQKFKKQYPMRIYFLAGEQEGANMVKNTNQMVKKLQSVGFKENEIQNITHADGQHSEWFWARELKTAVKWLLANVENDKKLFAPTDAHAIHQQDNQFALYLNHTSQYLFWKLPPYAAQASLEVEFLALPQYTSVWKQKYALQEVANLSHLAKGNYKVKIITDKGQTFTQEIYIEK